MSLRLPDAEYKIVCRTVLDRDGWMCRNPSCKFRNNLHVHHIVFRSEMGPDESWNLITVCSDCHDLIHAYALFISVVDGNHVGKGGGADGKVRFSRSEV
jgi:HNH endonuclease